MRSLLIIHTVQCSNMINRVPVVVHSFFGTKWGNPLSVRLWRAIVCWFYKGKKQFFSWWWLLYRYIDIKYDISGIYNAVLLSFCYTFSPIYKCSKSLISYYDDIILYNIIWKVFLKLLEHWHLNSLSLSFLVCKEDFPCAPHFYTVFHWYHKGWSIIIQMFISLSISHTRSLYTIHIQKKKDERWMIESNATNCCHLIFNI